MGSFGKLISFEQLLVEYRRQNRANIRFLWIVNINWFTAQVYELCTRKFNSASGFSTLWSDVTIDFMYAFEGSKYIVFNIFY